MCVVCETFSFITVRSFSLCPPPSYALCVALGVPRAAHCCGRTSARRQASSKDTKVVPSENNQIRYDSYYEYMNEYSLNEVLSLIVVCLHNTTHDYSRFSLRTTTISFFYVCTHVLHFFQCAGSHSQQRGRRKLENGHPLSLVSEKVEAR